MTLDRATTVGIAGFALCLCTIIAHNLLIPRVRDGQINKEILLKNGWPMRKAWAEVAFSFECRAYIFNVTNPKEISNGEKPIVREVGPFVYDVWQEKAEIVDHEDDDTVSYVTRSTYQFNAEKSAGLSDNDELTIPHLLSLGTSNGVMKDKAIFLTIASKAIDSVLRNPDSVFVREKVKTLLFDGFEIDCRQPEDFFGNAFCSDVRESWHEYRLLKKADDFYTTSFWGTLNATDIWLDKYRIRRGSTNISRVGELVEYNNKRNLSTWKDERCNAFSGTDGTMFRPFLGRKPTDELYVTNAHLCRRFLYRYVAEVQVSGMTLLRYATTMGTDMETNPQDRCFCIAADRCLKNGVFELFRCLSTPLILSNPHFYLADPSYANSVKGLAPDKEKHMTFVDVDPLTGTLVNARSRMQYSLFLTKLDKYRLAQNFSEALLPIMWSEQVVVLPESSVKDLKAIHRTMSHIKILECLSILGGLAMCAYSGYLHYSSRKKKNDVQHISAAQLHGNAAETALPIRVGGIRTSAVPTNID